MRVDASGILGSIELLSSVSLSYCLTIELYDSSLLKKANKRELKATQKNKINPERLPLLEGILRDVYAICRPKPIDYHNRRDLVRVFNLIAKEIYGNYAELF
ncbi:Nucleotidyltransferase [Sarracenia purpurea var. burkii]